MPLSFQDLSDLLVLNRLSLTGAKTVHGLLLEGLKPSEILLKIREENFLNKKEALLELQESFHPEKEMIACEKNETRFLTFLDSDYPELLKNIADPPLVLYLQGDLQPLDQAAIGIVGTRHPSLYGQTQAKKISRQLAEAGMTIVSGLAQGIDQAAHQAALEIPHGRTLAVLGCGLDVEYPSGSHKLRRKILERGAILSEYAFETAPRAENFPRRNRIIAGLSMGILVVEAHSRSGSLITARLAAEEGREVFAIPGSVDQPGSRGTHMLLKEGACLTENAEDILQVLGPMISQQKTVPLPKFEKDPKPFSKTQVLPENTHSQTELLELLREKALSPEEIIDRLELPAGSVSTKLTLLELQGKVRRNLDGSFILSKEEQGGTRKNRDEQVKIDG